MMQYALTQGKMSPRVEFAYNAWKNQRKRCRNPRGKDFKNYGGNGINVEYSSREFIDWFLKNTSDEDYRYVVGRIDHSKGYSFDNIQLETRRQSSLEMLDRTARRRAILIMDKFTSEPICKAKSVTEAARICGVKPSVIFTKIQRGQQTPRRRGLLVRFKYL